MSRAKLAVVCALCSAVGLPCWSAVANAAEPTPEGAPARLVEEGHPTNTGATELPSQASETPVSTGPEPATPEADEPAPTPISLEGPPLVIEGSPTEPEQRQAEEEARLMSPEAVLGREESELAYTGLSPSESKELVGSTFPALVEEPNGGAPTLPNGEHISSFSSEFTASVELPGGSRGTLESAAPIAVNTASGPIPVDLIPRQTGSGYEASTPAVGMHVQAGDKLSEGASLANLGVSLTPVTEDGKPLEGDRAVDGASLFFGDSEDPAAGVTDVDSLIKFDTYGFSEETILRSELAPQALYFKVGLPEGATLVQPQDDPNSLEVMAAGQVIARIAAPSGHDAEGTLIPLSVAVSGNLITLTVEHQPGQYKFPIEVDPTTYDTQVVDIHNGVTYQSRWKVDTSNNKEGPFYFSESSSYGIRDYHGQGTSPEYQRGEWGGFAYETQGESAIYDVHLGSSFGDEGHGFENRAQIKNKTPTGKNESPLEIRTNSYSEGAWPGWTLCILAECAVPGEVTPEIAENNVSLVQFASQTGNYTMDAELGGAYIYIVQTKNSAVSLDTTDPEIAGAPNALYGTEHWVKGTGAVKGKATDPGIGLSEVGFTSPQESKWVDTEAFPYPASAECEGVICPREQNYAVNLTGLPDGKDTVTFSGQNDTDTKAQAAKISATVYVDNTPPHNIVLSGLPTSKEIGAGEYKLTAEASDGSGTTASSGIKSMTLLIDGREVGVVPASCSPGPCTAHSAAWTIFGHNYATGEHILTVEATDNAGNASSETFTMTVHPASPVALGPAVVNPLSGELSLTANDVSIGGLSVSRSYDSQHLTEGETGPISAQWGFSLGGQENLIKQPNGSMVLTGATGAQTIFASDGKGGYVSPVGDSNLALSSTPCEAGQSEFMLKNAAAATTTCFKVPAGGTSEVWTPSITKGTVATDTVTYSYERSAKGIIEPTEVLAPVPAGVSCSPELKPGCRALSFNYAGSTTATGEAPSEWGDYSGHLARVYYWAYDPVSKAMKMVEVAHYLYDKQARLRTEWDPRISPALKTTYGYDSEGHVTALTAPGQETWAFTYGTIPGDTTAGRALKVTQGTASTTLWAGEGVKNTGEGPTLTGSPVMGNRMTVSDGTWSGNPVAYAYQWQDCNALGAECKAIPGATNANYTPGSGDVGHKVVAQVAATNGSGSLTVASAASTTVTSTGAGGPPSVTQSVDPGNGINAVSCIPATTDCVVSDSAGKLFYATNVSTAGATWQAWSGPGTSPSEAVSCPTSSLCLLAAGSDSGYGGNMYYATSLGGAWTQAYSPSYGVDAIACTSSTFCIDGQDGGGFFRYSTSPASTSWTLEEQGSSAMKGVFCVSLSFCAMVDGAGSVHVATTTTQIESSGWTSTVVDGSTALNGVACSSTTSCVAVDGAGNVINLAIGSGGAATATKHNIDSTNSLNAITCTGTTCATVDSAGNIFVSTNAGETWTRQYQPGGKLTSVSCASSSLCATVDATGNVTSFNPSASQSVDPGNGINAVSCIPATTDCVVSDSAGKLFYATNVSTAGATWQAWSGPGTSPSEAVSCPTSSLCLLAAGSDSGYGGNMYYATSLGGAWTQAYSPSYGVDAIACTSSTFCIDGQDGGGFFRYSTSPASTSWTLEEQGSSAMKGVFCVSLSFCAMVDGAGSVHVATTTTQIESSGWTSTVVDGSTALNGVACSSTTSCVAVDGAGNVINLAIGSGGAATATKHNIDSTNSLNAITCTGTTCATVDSAGNIFVSTNAGETWTRQYQPGGKLTSVSCATGSLCVTADSSGNVTIFNPAGGTAHEGELRSPQPGSTVEYNVPLSGSGLPTLTSSEVEKWAQKDVPTEATAVFPPDEPQTWPASRYRRATIYYRDNTSRTVNVETPGGAISTSEYNEHNDVTRSLSASSRVAALKEAKPAEAAKLVDTQSEYNSEGTELLSTLGPRHTVRLASGKEVQARSHTVYHYDEGAPETGGPYRLVTKTTQGAEIEGEAEQDIRTTVSLFSGQNGLGWTLRKPTAVISDPAGLKLTRRTVYDPGTGNVVETRAPGASGPLPYLRYQSSWGTTGLPSVYRAEGITIDKEGNIWVADTENNRVIELWSNGTLRRTVGSLGTGNGQFSKPAGIATDSAGDVWVADTGNNRVQELSSTGVYIRQAGKYGTGNGEFKSPRGITVDSTGHAWVADTGNDRVQELSSEAAYVTQYGSPGTGNGQFKQPYAVAVDKEGNIWVGDSANGRIQELSSTGTYIRQFGREGNTKPCQEEAGEMKCPSWWTEGLTIDAAGHIWATESSKVEEFSSTGTAITHFGTFGHGEGQVEYPKGIAIDSESHVWLADTGNSRIQELTSAGAYVRQYPGMTTPATLNNPKAFARNSSGETLVADTASNRIQQVSATGSFVRQSFWNTTKTEGIGVDGKGNIWFSSAEGWIERDSATMEPEWATASFNGAGEGGNFKEPAGIAFSGEKMYVVDRGNNRIVEGEGGTYVRKFGTLGSGNGQLSKPQGDATDSKGDVWVADTGNNRIEEFSPEGAYMAAYGTLGSGNGQFSKPQGIAVDSEGNIWVADTGNNRVQVLSPMGVYIKQFGTAGSGAEQMKEPTDVTTDSSHHVYVLDAGNGRVQTWLNEGEAEYAGSPHGALTVYYTTAANSKYPSCGGHAEWATMPCEQLPSAQPETTGIPNLPVSTVTYNMYGEPLQTTSTVGTNTRTSTITYDEAGRPLTSETASSVGKAIPPVTDKYSETTGALTEQSKTVEGKLEAIISSFNSIGQLASYTDASGNMTKYEYETGGDARLKRVEDGKGAQAYTYDETTGAVNELVDTQGTNRLAFTASYDVEGNMTSEGYPNGMSANYTRNQAGEPTGLTYVKTSNCSENCTWFTDTASPSIHRQWLSQQSTLASETYQYDAAGRLTQTLETVGTEGCTARIYAYDEETNRTNLTTRAPGTGGTCASEGGTSEGHTYDSANRLTDAGVAYEPFGEVAKLPASDAGGAELQSTYFADGRLHEQQQKGQTIGYVLDPTGRTSETIDTGTVNSTYVSHYAGAGQSPSWTTEPTSGHWTRYVSGISGFAAVETDTEAPVLELQDLQGNVVARASISETATKLLSTERSTEYGVPTTSTPKKYGWQGGGLLATELSSGVVAMGARSYIPQVGRFLQTDPIEGGSANAYAYTFGDPVNSSDPTGEYTWGFSEGLVDSLNTQGEEIIAREAAREQLAREEAERAAAAAAEAEATLAAELAANSPTEGGVEEAGEEVMVLTLHLGGGLHGKRARAAKFSLKAGFEKIEKTVSNAFQRAKTKVETYANELWEGVNSELFQKSVDCVKGATDLSDTLEAEDWKEYPLIIATIDLVGCAGGTEDIEWGPRLG